MKEFIYGPRYITLLGANLPEKEVQDLTGWTNYRSPENYLINSNLRMLQILVQEGETQEYFIWTFFISDEVVQSRNGKFVYMDDYGNASFYTYDPPKDFVNPYKSRKGERSLVKILRILSGYEPVVYGTSWKEFLEEEGVYFEDVLGGRIEGLNHFIDKQSARGATVGCLFTEKGNYQNIETDSSLIFEYGPNEDIPEQILKELYKFNTPGNYSPIRGNIELEQILIEI